MNPVIDDRIECDTCHVRKQRHMFAKGRRKCNSCRWKQRYAREKARRPPPNCIACHEDFEPPGGTRIGRDGMICQPCQTDPCRITPCRSCDTPKPRAEFGAYGQAADRCNECHVPVLARSKRNYDLKRKYGVDMNWYERQFEKQDGRCALPSCRTPLGRVKPFAVDHHELSGQVREILCNRHNLGIGTFHEDVNELRDAMEYLERHGRRGAAGIPRAAA